jgi:hypothetical protein
MKKMEVTKKWNVLYKKHRLEQLFKELRLPDLFQKMFDSVSSAWIEGDDYFQNYNIHLNSSYETPDDSGGLFHLWNDLNGDEIYYQKPELILQIRYNEFTGLRVIRGRKNEQLLACDRYQKIFDFSEKHFESLKKAKDVYHVLLGIDYKELLK